MKKSEFIDRWGYLPMENMGSAQLDCRVELEEELNRLESPKLEFTISELAKFIKEFSYVTYIDDTEPYNLEHKLIKFIDTHGTR